MAYSVNLNKRVHETCGGKIRHSCFLRFCKLKRKIFGKECNKCCFVGFAFDVDFGCFVQLTTARACERGFKGFIVPGPGLGGPGIQGPGRVQVSALSFGIAP